MPFSAAQSNDGFLPTPMRAIAPYFILLLIVFAAYSNIFDNTFLYDDNALIAGNEYLRGWNHIGDILTSSTNSGVHLAGGFYRPLQMLLYLLIFHMGDGSTFLFHLLNLSLHAANTCFVYRLGTKLGFKPWGVFLAALVWGAHPLHTEAVTYMSATADPLFAFFCLWAITFLVPDITLRKIVKTIPLFLLGLCSKESAIILPLLVMSCLFLVSPQRLNIRTYLGTWPLWGIALLYAIWRLHTSNFYGSQYVEDLVALPVHTSLKEYAYHPTYRIYTFLATLPNYFVLLIWPHNLHMDRDFPLYGLSFYDAVRTVPVMMGFGIVVLAAAQIVRSCKKPYSGLEISWGLLWFAAAHAPDSGLLIPVNSLFLEHWMYLPSVGLFLGLFEGLAKLLHNHSRTFLICSIAALVFAGSMLVKTYEQNAVWHDPLSFSSNIIYYNKNSFTGHSLLGTYYTEIGEYASAIDQYKQAIQISDIQPVPRYNLAMTYLNMSNWADYIPETITNLERSLELDPHYNSLKCYLFLSYLYDQLNDHEKAQYYQSRATILLQQEQGQVGNNSLLAGFEIFKKGHRLITPVK